MQVKHSIFAFHKQSKSIWQYHGVPEERMTPENTESFYKLCKQL